jgi:TolB-like protein/Tfp pilus assembly protein PilF
VKVLDFGLAMLFERGQTAVESDEATYTAADSTSKRALAGTLFYMSPEQARCEKLDSRTDVFSLGVVLYEMTTGQRPFRGATFAEVLREIEAARPVPPHERVRKLPLEMDRILQKALARRRSNRYQTMDDLAVDLKRLARELETGSSPSYEDVAAPRASGRRPRTLIAAVATMVVLLAMLFGLDVVNWRGLLLGGAGSDRVESLAVLPLENLSGDPEQEFFADGMTEALIMNLSKLEALKVISRTSVMRYKDTEKSTPQIARELGVDAIVEGSVLVVEGKVRVTAQLIEGPTDSRLWGDSYDRVLEDVLALQTDIATAIADEVKTTVTPEERSRLMAGPVDPEAYEAYLKGRFFWNKRTKLGLQKAIEYFQEAIEKDDTYALAYVGLAQSYNVSNNYGGLSPDESFPRAKEAALKALEIDNTLAQAHTALAHTFLRYEWDWSSAEREFKQAIGFDNNYATGHQWYGFSLTVTGRFDEALIEFKRAQELDPLSPIINMGVAWGFFFARRHEASMEQCRKTLELEPDFHVAYWVLGLNHLQLGMHEEAIREFQRAYEFSGGDPQMMGLLGHAYAVSGKEVEARKIIEDLGELGKQRYVSPFQLAIIYSGLQENDLALEWLEKAYQERYYWLGQLGVDPTFDNLRRDARFVDLLERLGLPE